MIYLLRLNDGTDEIYNLNPQNVKSLKSLEKDKKKCYRYYIVPTEELQTAIINISNKSCQTEEEDAFILALEPLFKTYNKLN